MSFTMSDSEVKSGYAALREKYDAISRRENAYGIAEKVGEIAESDIRGLLDHEDPKVRELASTMYQAAIETARIGREGKEAAWAEMEEYGAELDVFERKIMEAAE